MRTPTVTRTVALIGCSAEKLDRRAPARELYTSPLFRLSLAYAEEVLGAETYVLSAQHGLVRLDQELDPYDLSLTEMDAWERAWWRHEVEHQLAELLGAVPAEGDDEDQRYFLHQPGTRWVLLAGALYRPPEILGVTWEEPLRGMGIGQRKAWLKSAVKAGRAQVEAPERRRRRRATA